MKLIIKTLVFVLLFSFLPLSLPAQAAEKSFTERISGQILLDVEKNGEAYYVNSEDNLAYYLKNGPAAYTLMRNLSLGISDENLKQIPSIETTTEMRQATSICASNPLAARLSGRILLQTEQHGEAWYIFPDTCRRIYMKDGEAAYTIMRFLGLGASSADVQKAVNYGQHIRGNENAKITLVEYSDFECSFCQNFTPTLDRLLKEYPNDIKLEYRHFPLQSIHLDAYPAALASECASEQNKFWEFHNELYINQNNLDSNLYKKIALRLELDIKQFNNCLDSKKYKNKVNRNINQGLEQKVNGTPSTVILYIDKDTAIISGAQTYETIKPIIDNLIESFSN